jgi:hypothetical protein
MNVIDILSRLVPSFPPTNTQRDIVTTPASTQDYEHPRPIPPKRFLGRLSSNPSFKSAAADPLLSSNRQPPSPVLHVHRRLTLKLVLTWVSKRMLTQNAKSISTSPPPRLTSPSSATPLPPPPPPHQPHHPPPTTSRSPSRFRLNLSHPQSTSSPLNSPNRS